MSWMYLSIHRTDSVTGASAGPGRMAVPAFKPKYGWDESEHADLLKAIRAPLFAIAQTPLQVGEYNHS